MKARHKKYYMDIAKLSAQQSYAKRLQVGACAVKGSRIISTSWNGTPSGTDNTCEYVDSDGELKTKDSVLHAEENLILKAAADGQATRGAVLFITHAPCIHCARMIYGAQFSEVIYNEEYRSLQGVEFLRSVGVAVSKYSEEGTQDVILFKNPIKLSDHQHDDKVKKKKELFDDMNSLISSVVTTQCEIPPTPMSLTIQEIMENGGIVDIRSVDMSKMKLVDADGVEILPPDTTDELTLDQFNKLNESNHRGDL